MRKLTTLFFLIGRFTWFSNESTIRAMIIICFTSITLGSFALALVMAIMNGFEHETRAVIQGIQPDILITAEGQPLAYNKIKQVLNQEFSKTIVGSAPHAQAHTLVRSSAQQTSHQATPGSLAVLFGIDPDQEQTISTLGNTLISESTKPKQTLPELLQGNQVIIGASLAHALAVRTGDTLTLLFAPEEQDTESIDTVVLEQKKVVVAGIFKTGIHDIDAHVIALDKTLLNSFYPTAHVTQIGIKLADKSTEKQVITELKERLGLTVLSWHELYPALLAALTLEKYTMFIIGMLITLVASMNIISLLYMYVTHKQAEIAIARTLGVTRRELLALFMGIGTLVATTAASVGTLLAIVAGYILKNYIPLPLPDIYYVSHVPVQMTPLIAGVVILLAACIGSLASFIPARRIQKISLARILRST